MTTTFASYDEIREALDLDGRTPLQALASAYAERLCLVRAGAEDDEFAANDVAIAVLENLCRRPGRQEPARG